MVGSSSVIVGARMYLSPIDGREVLHFIANCENKQCYAEFVCLIPSWNLGNLSMQNTITSILHPLQYPHKFHQNQEPKRQSRLSLLLGPYHRRF